MNTIAIGVALSGGVALDVVTVFVQGFLGTAREWTPQSAVPGDFCALCDGS
jgi:hypothetical protein